MHFSQFIGVDISKDTLDAAIYPAKDKKMDFLHFDNKGAQRNAEVAKEPWHKAFRDGYLRRAYRSVHKSSH